jgi:hypothetical protein
VPAASARAPTLAGLAVGAAPAPDDPHVSRGRARLTWVNGVSSVPFVHVRTSRCALCDDNGAAVVHEGHLTGCSYFQEFRDGANNQGNAHTRRLVWDAYAENTSGRRL